MPSRVLLRCLHLSEICVLSIVALTETCPNVVIINSLKRHSCYMFQALPEPYLVAVI